MQDLNNFSQRCEIRRQLNISWAELALIEAICQTDMASAAQLGVMLGLSLRGVETMIGRLKARELLLVEKSGLIPGVQYSQLANSQKPVKSRQNLRKKCAKSATPDKTDATETTTLQVTVEKSMTHKEIVSKLYYDAIKALDLPVRNHSHVNKKIVEMAKDPDQQKIVNYLKFVATQYGQTEWEHKPQISEALDIYGKRAQIRETMKSSITGRYRRKNSVLILS